MSVLAEIGDHNLLSGAFELSTLPAIPSKVVRVYLCCTATDTTQERNALIQRVYPHLREYCREKYGLEFQVVDPRWGNDEDWPDHSEDRQLCMRELEQCQRDSCGPNFMVLLGQRYGASALPATISAEHFELVRTTLRRHKNRDTRDVATLDLWYLADHNSMPPVYRLQTVNMVRRNLRPQTAVEKAIYGERKDIDWQDTKEALTRLLTRGVEYCLQEGTMVDSDAFTYLSTDFEKEIRQGLLFTHNPKDTCQVFSRTIVDLKNYLSHPAAQRFLEVKLDHQNGNKPKLNEHSEKAFNKLKEKNLPKWLPKSNIHESSVLWKHDEGISKELHATYLEDLCQEVESSTRELIDHMANQFKSGPPSPLHTEVWQHWLMAKEKCQIFTGREGILDIIKSYVVSNDSCPLVIYGETGSGKSSAVAKAATQVSDWLQGEVVNIVRFLGTTSSSFDVRQILHNICLQIAELLGQDPNEIPNSYKDLQSYFHNVLEEFPEDKNLVIFLDSLHMLVPQYNSHYLSWLPRELKENVKLVVSTDPTMHAILDRLRKEVVHEENNYVEMAAMSENECLDLLLTLLGLEDRTLSAEQQKAVCQAFQKCGRPLYVKLLATDAQSWGSYDDIDPESFPIGCKEYINVMLEHLEIKHGKALVSRAIAYITASTTGLSDCELEDILSLDDTVLTEVSQKLNLSIRRLPSLVWLRLKYDIHNFLTSHECEGMIVNFWNHKYFVEVARDRYLQDGDIRKEIHSGIADYQLGVWSGKKKPFRCASVINNNEVEMAEDRLVPKQPLTFKASDTETRYNRRKYDQVPRHLYLSGRLRELNELVLFSYDWLYNKTKALSLDSVLADFVLNPGVEATLVEKALRDAQPFIEKHIDNMAPEISGRLLAYYPTHTHIRKLIQECDRLGLKHCAFIPNFPYHQVPGSPLKYAIDCKGKPQHFSLTGNDGRYILAKQQDKPLVQMFDLATGEHQGDITTSVGEMHVTPSGDHIIIVDHVTEKALKIHNTETGKFLGQLIPMNHVQLKPKEKYKLSKVCVSDNNICLTITTEKSYLFIAELSSMKFVQVLGLEGRSTLCEITPDSRYVFCSANENLLAYDLETLQKVNHTALERRPSKITFNADTTRAFLINGVENRLYMMTLSGGSVDFLYKVNLHDEFQDDVIQDLSLSNNQEMLLVRGKSNVVVYHVTPEKVLCHFKRPSDIPKEFKLPMSYYREITFTQAYFSPDDKFVIASLFRNVCIWHIANNRLQTSLQAPVGLISELFIPPERGQVVTHQEGSSMIHVWSLGDAIGHVGMLDRLTMPVEEIILTKSDKTAFVRCSGSDEIGVLDMRSGQLVDLLTHESPVQNISITPKGDYVFVSLRDAKLNAFNKVWHTTSRQIIYEFGNVPADSVSLHDEDSFIVLCQESKEFKAPYRLAMLKMSDGDFSEYRLENEVSFLLARPFVTAGDKYLVILSADDYIETHAHYQNPTICALSLDANMQMTTYSAMDLASHVKITRILNIQPYPGSSYTIIVLYTNEPDPFRNGPITRSYDHCYSFMVFDVCSGVLCHVLDDFLAPSTPIDSVLFTKDVSRCLDHQSNLFDLSNGYFVKRICSEEAPPRKLALGGKVAVYFQGPYLFGLRVADDKRVAHVHAHGEITSLEVCHDERSLVVGRADGALVSYVLIDDAGDNTADVIAKMNSRQVKPKSSSPSKIFIRTWDRVDSELGAAYSRPPSAMVIGPSDRQMLKRVKPVSRTRPASDTLLYTGQNKSRACIVM